MARGLKVPDMYNKPSTDTTRLSAAEIAALPEDLKQAVARGKAWIAERNAQQVQQKPAKG